MQQKRIRNQLGGSFFDSLGGHHAQYKDGLKGTVGDKNVKIISSVRLFLNVCASYIGAINMPNQEGRTYDYLEPFGHCRNTKGSTKFSRLDFESPSILKQQDAFNCGIACVANAVGFVRHFKKTDFALSDMRLVIDDPDETWYIVDGSKYNLNSFWEQLVKKFARKYDSKVITTVDVLPKLRMEFVVVTETLSGMYLGKPKEDEVIKVIDADTETVIDLTIRFPTTVEKHDIEDATTLDSSSKNDAKQCTERTKQKLEKKRKY